MHDDDEKKKNKKKAKKPGDWTPMDILLGLFGLAALSALAAAGFKLAKWAVATYLI
ncbi:MAG: hypothetical protein V1816_27325 [Pseudomonadota bacterium]